ncbi:hypothetical protein RHMOL_Rhmol05G0157900 [Rhododendron molle]|uniref:Uncharacterized protein n=2 Tax=Rhododendron molle TaxID=49168 RepID=A0ACC0NPQ0_RHOML|nr:hypothetical protein RHMOL_Rhmol05G0157900 [Rhododendron molle]KAI8555225.1 hypothetical protein RHMOL_Rhmol05G0157900 [Rhododendron molle]
MPEDITCHPRSPMEITAHIIDFQKFERTMRGMQGALIVASCFQMLIGFLGVWGNVVRFLTPLFMVPLMTFTGLGLYYVGFQMLQTEIEKAFHNTGQSVVTTLDLKMKNTLHDKTSNIHKDLLLKDY